jgi:hypothetical protein
MDREEIIINLKLIEKIQKSQKISTRDLYLNIEAESLIPECIRRWRRQDSRDTTIKKINEIVNTALLLLDKEEGIKEYLKNSVKGIVNLKETYVSCNQTCARLDTIIDKINAIV